MERMLRIAGWLVLTSCLLSGGTLHAQTRTMHISFDNTPLLAAIGIISDVSETNIVYNPDLIPDQSITLEVEGNLEQVLTAVLRFTGITYRVQDGQVVLFTEAQDLTPFVVSGYVEDMDSGERLIGAHVFDLRSGTGAATNEYGFFSLQSRGSNASIRLSYLGYQSDTIVIRRQESSTQQIKLRRLIVLKEVVIESRQGSEGIVPLGKHHFTERQLEMRSNLGGEMDVQRYAGSLPGVSTGTDGIGGMHVRGGNGDQNLILFDGVPIYHSTHAIGILSVFNPLMVRDVTLQKGAFPARYAGRLSSVMDVRTREGSNKQWSLQSSIGPATVNALVEGPVVRDKVGILVAARRFVPGFYLRNLSRNQKASDGYSGETQYGFTDLNAKCNISLSPKDRFYFSLYYGDDSYNDETGEYFEFGSFRHDEGYQRELNWGNTIGVFRWNHQIGDELFANATVTLSSFELQSLDKSAVHEVLPDNSEFNSFVTREFKSRIKDASVRLDFDYFISNANRFRYGFTYTRHVISPKSIAFGDEAIRDGFPLNEDTLEDALFSSFSSTAVESGIYLDDEAQIGEHVEVSAGVHLATFNIRKRKYLSAQPRLTIGVEVFPGIRLFGSTGITTQYLHLLTSSGIGFPTDLWVPATQAAPPQRAFQGSLGASWQITDALSIQTDAYVRRLSNLIAYQEGASFLLKNSSVEIGLLDAANWEDKVTQGTGKARGLETTVLYAAKGINLEGSYTLSKSTRQFDELNEGKEFAFRFDRRHAFSFTGSAHISEKLQVSASWIYASGVPITLAQSRIEHPSTLFAPIDVIEYSERNAYRLPPYHRLDIGAAYYWRRPKAVHSLHLDVYNLYNRHNILHVALIESDQVFKNRRYTVLPMIPSISYRLKI